MTQPNQIAIDKIERQTEKAILVKHQIGYCSSVGRRVSIWWPKSQITLADDGKSLTAPAWLAVKKLDDFVCGGTRPWFE